MSGNLGEQRRCASLPMLGTRNWHQVVSPVAWPVPSPLTGQCQSRLAELALRLTGQVVLSIEVE